MHNFYWMGRDRYLKHLPAPEIFHLLVLKNRQRQQRAESQIKGHSPRLVSMSTAARCYKVILATHYRVYPFPKNNSNKLHTVVKALTDLIDCPAASVDFCFLCLFFPPAPSVLYFLIIPHSSLPINCRFVLLGGL